MFPARTRLYAQATVRTLAGFLGRAYSQKQTFPTAEAFLAAGGESRLRSHAGDWLPPKLLEGALRDASRIGRWRLKERKRSTPLLICTMPDGTVLTGSFTATKSHIGAVSVHVKGPSHLR